MDLSVFDTNANDSIVLQLYYSMLNAQLQDSVD